MMPPLETADTASIEAVLVRHNHRGMDGVRRYLTSGYLSRAAELIAE